MKIKKIVKSLEDIDKQQQEIIQVINCDTYTDEIKIKQIRRIMAVG